MYGMSMNISLWNVIDLGDNPFRDWLAAQQVACMTVARAHLATEVAFGFGCGWWMWMRVHNMCPMDLGIGSMILFSFGLCDMVGLDMIPAQQRSC